MKYRRLPPLNALRAFDAASRHMSFQKAADELSVTPSALSFQIRQLEEHLQIQLFERHNRRVELTDAGRRFAPAIQAGFEQLHSAMHLLTPTTPDNVLTVSTGPAFAAKWLSPRIHRFLELHPDIEFRIAASLNLTDLRDEQIDAVIRFGGGNYPGLHVEPLREETALPMVSPQLLERHGGRLTLDDLSTITLLHDDSTGFLPNAVTWPVWLQAAGASNVDGTRGARFSHADHAIDAALDGAGIVLGRLTIAARDISAGRLVVPFEKTLPSRAGFYFCCLPEMVDRPKVAAFRAFIRQEIAAEQHIVDAYRAD